MTKVNISREIIPILKKLGLEPPFVKALHIEPTRLVATVYRKDENGKKYLVPTHPVLPLELDEDGTSFGRVPATQEIEYEVRT